VHQQSETTMRRARAFLIRCAGFFGKHRRDRELDAEIESHLALHATENEKRGMNSADARREAVLKLGGVESLKESYRDRRSIPMLETLLQDARYALRLIRKNPLFSAVTILILALGIGSNVAIFSVVNAMLLRPLPYAQGQRLVHFSWAGKNSEVPSVSAPEFIFWRDNNRSFDYVGAYDLFASGANFSVGGAPQFVHLLNVTQDFFPTLGIEPRFGRNFTAEECTPGGPRAAMLTYGLWQNRFGGDTGIVGRAVDIDGNSVTVVGVLPQSFEFATDADVWSPLRLEFNPADGAHNYLMLGRLRSGATLEQAQSEMPEIMGKFKSLYPGTGNSTARGMRLGSYQTWLVGWVRTSLLVLFGAVGLILLISMVNVTSLLLAKSSSRSKELAIRASLGAGRIRLLRQMTIEAIILALAAGVAGLAVASATLRAVIAASPRSLPSIPFSPFIGFTQQIGLNGVVIAFTVGVAVLIGTIVGVIASLRATRVDVYEAMKEGSLAVTGSRGRQRSHYVLVIAETALSVVLLSGALLLIRSLDKLQHVSLGFDANQLWSAEFNLPAVKYPTRKAVWQFEQELIRRVQSQPGVTEVATASATPLNQVMNTWIYPSGGDPSKGLSEQYYSVSSDYLKTMHTALRSGRGFLETDAVGAQPVVIINEEVARNFWKDSNPVGKLLNVAEVGPPRPKLIIGVVADTKQLELGEDPQPAVYIPEAQVPEGQMGLSRSAVSSALLIRSQAPISARTIQQIFSDSDPAVAIAHYRSLNSVISESLTPEKFETGALSTFAGLALVLTAVGIYGVLAYLLSKRTHEVGIRMALGAQPRDVLFLALKQGMAPVLIGVVLGLAGAAAAMRLMASLLFGVTPSDPLTFAAVAAILSVVALAACYFPARRATRIDPVVALRQ
jgi:putative ABC transport system permease protein